MSTTNTPFDNVWASLESMSLADDHDNAVADSRRVFAAVKTFATADNALMDVVGGGLESFDDLGKKVQLNDAAAMHLFEGANGTSFETAVETLLDNAGFQKNELSGNARRSLMKSIATILQGGVESASHFQMTARGDKSVAPMHMITSRGALGGILADVNSVKAFESFGVNIDHVTTDSRLNIALTIIRARKSLMDRVMARVSHKDPVIKIRIPEAEIYDLGKSQGSSAATRYGDHRHSLIEMYRKPELVDTTTKRIKLLKSNDTGGTSVLVADDVVVPGVRLNMFDLASDGTPSSQVDWTDLVSEGVMIKTVLVQVTLAGSPDVVNTFAVPVDHYAAARFTEHDNQPDSSVRIAHLRDAVFNLKKTTTQSDGSAQGVIDGIDDADAIRLRVSFNGEVDLKTSNISGTPTVTAEAVVLGDADGDTAAATDTVMGNLTFEVVGWTPDAYYSEENVRKADLAVRHIARTQAYEIPVGRTSIADFSLQQVETEEVLNTMGAIADIGNSSRGLSVIRGHLDTVAARNVLEKEMGDVEYHQKIGRQYAAGTQVNPYVVKTTIDVADAGVAVMRESERLSDLHALVRSRLLAIDSVVKTQSHYLTVFEPGETPVIKIIASRALVDTLFGIDDYHNALSDLPHEGGRKQAGSDYSFMLQNDTRVDVYGVDYESMDGKFIGFYVRDEGNENNVTSFAAVRDCGNYIGQYTLTNGNAANKRFLMNTREIPFVTNPIGFDCTVEGLDAIFDGLDFGGEAA